MMDIERLTHSLQKEMMVAMGCTEPAAAALAGAKARELLGCEPEQIRIYASRDMLKNAMGVGIPNCEERGIKTAVCLGISGGNPLEKLNILSSVTEEQKRRAARLTNLAELAMKEHAAPVYIRVELKAGAHSAVCEICHQHDQYSYMAKDGQVLCAQEGPTSQEALADVYTSQEYAALSLEEITRFAREVPLKQVEFVWEGACTNREMAEFSLQGDYGLRCGRTILADQTGSPANLTEAIHLGAGLAAAASEARMSGCPRPVVINSGSGNQGITCSVPVLALAEYLGCDHEKTVRALCVSQLIGLVLSARKDRLSALCGAFTAAIGTGCAFVWLLGGDAAQMDGVVRNMLGNLTGMVCDGAKQTCALKIYSCVQAAGLSARMAMEGSAPGKESGIVGKDFAQCVDRMTKITHEGMLETDKTILSIMLEE